MAPAKYVVPPLASRARPAPRAVEDGTGRRPAAILVVHGMGQQIPFQTLDDVAEGLQRLAPRTGAEPQPVARTIIVGDERLSRLEVTVRVSAEGATRDVHVYEAYWAPLTEGQVTLRDVMRFLFTSGLGGIRSGWQPFKRWLFGTYVEFPAPVRTVLYLATALAVVASLVLLNILIVAITAARAPFTTPPGWLTHALFSDITTVFNFLIAVFVAFGSCLALAMQRRVTWLRRAAGAPSVVLFVASIWATLVAAAASGVIVVRHLSQPGGGSVFNAIGASVLVEGFNRRIDIAILVIVVGVGSVLGLYWAWTFLRRLVTSVRTDAESRGLTVVVFAIVLTIAVSIIALAGWLVQRTLPYARLLQLGRQGIAWPLVIVAAALVRGFLVQYVGDVVAYVQSQTLDRFHDLRQRIKDLVWRKAHAVFSMSEYDDVILVGHSLGSVLIYDTLNRLLTEEAQVPGAPRIASRTRLLLTFGSPLDKTAFLFGAQGTGSEAREALAASVQPLINDRTCRPEWVNVYSRWDIISARLIYYDLPDRSNPNPIDNRPDREATALLAAHVEYWKNPTIFREIVKRLG